jgi:4-hydroxy-tetrahydrodipicolinate reductase
MSHHNTTQNYRVVQWGAGNVGARAMRAVIQHPDMTLVGLKEMGEKVGRDAGELCGVGPIGIIATESIDEVIALKPDCVLYMQQGTNFDDVCKLLASGANIVTTCVGFNYPGWLDPAVREQVEEACRRGGTSIHGTGSSPGFITEAVPIVLTSIMRRLDCLTIDEFADLSWYEHPVMVFDVMNYGKPVAEMEEIWLIDRREHFGPTISLIAEALGLPLDSVEVSGQSAAARNKTHIAAGVIEAGTVGAHQITITGMRGGRPVVRFRANWYCTKDIDASWNLGDTGWHVVAEGDPPLDVEIHFPVPREQLDDVTPGLTAYRPVNAIPYVCAAPPGIQTAVDLPQIIAKLG